MLNKIYRQFVYSNIGILFLTSGCNYFKEYHHAPPAASITEAVESIWALYPQDISHNCQINDSEDYLLAEMPGIINCLKTQSDYHGDIVSIEVLNTFAPTFIQIKTPYNCYYLTNENYYQEWTILHVKK